eukprot:TRINITY_DN3606_c0_g2_i1.p1 TRINITY_DN3606_c0_g2~~TRINITY_DN3606_c0_g2_i1.p1  ORF type:complete len:386 (-),score=50.26 TRINITY_DN3606_c0_g2_i1:80-1237(-)
MLIIFFAFLFAASSKQFQDPPDAQEQAFIDFFIYGYRLRLDQNVSLRPQLPNSSSFHAEFIHKKLDLRNIEEMIDKALEYREKWSRTEKLINSTLVCTSDEELVLIARATYEYVAADLVSQGISLVGESIGKRAGLYVGAEIGLAVGVFFPPASVLCVVAGSVAGTRIGGILGKYAGKMIGGYINDWVEEDLITQENVQKAVSIAENTVDKVVDILTGQVDLGGRMSDCLLGKWGTNCTQDCPPHCALSFYGSCTEDGKCLGYTRNKNVSRSLQTDHCETGYQGDNCSIPFVPLGYSCDCFPYCHVCSPPHPCPVGTAAYTGWGWGYPSCIICLRGSYASSPASLVCTKCPSGYSCDNPSKPPVPCPVGTHGCENGYGQAACCYN